MKIKNRLLLTAVLALLAIMPAAAQADPVTLTLQGTVTVQAGSSVTMIGTIANGGNPSFNISSWTITLGSALLTFDDTGFQGSPFVLNSGDSFGPTGFFDIFADIALAPGNYAGSFTVRDDVRLLTVTRDFRINVTGGQTIPEPASMLLLGSGLAGVAALRRKRRQKSG